jgi:hypothetical protein
MQARRRAGLSGFPRRLLQDHLVQRQVGDRGVKPEVLRRQILQTLDLIALQPAELPAPAVIRYFLTPIERIASPTL